MLLIVLFLDTYNNMKLQSIYTKHILEVITSPFALARWVIIWLIVGSIGWYFMDIPLIIWNQWHIIAYAEVSLFVLFVILFGFFVSVSVYKLQYFNAQNKKQLSMWWVWWILSMLVIWCPACSITLASYIWLASVISLLPFQWFELKVLWIVVLWYAIVQSLKTLHTCAMQKRTPTDRNNAIRLSAYIIWFLLCMRWVIDFWVKNKWFTI